MHAFRMFFIKHQAQALLSKKCADGRLIKDAVTRELAEAYRSTFPRSQTQFQQFAQQGAWRSLLQNRHEAAARHTKVFRDAKLAAYPLMCAEANMTAAYARAVCKEAYDNQNWTHSMLNNAQCIWPDAFP